VPKSAIAAEMYEMMLKEYGIQRLLAIEVNHCPQSYACLIESEAHGKLVYSGDTLPCQNLINYASQCKVLIHEATHEDMLENDAFAKKHTTMSQAIDIGIKANAWRTILTHFSPRYNKVAELEKSHIEKKALIAFDHMRVSFS
jgi:ribonuclease Z